MNNVISRKGLPAAASGGRGGNGRNCGCSLAPIKIHTPANCRRLSCLKVIAGSGEPGQDISITIDCSLELCARTNEFGTFRECLGEALCPGFHTINASYKNAPECPGDCVWVYISEPVILPPPLISFPENGSVVTTTTPLITGFAFPGNLVIVSAGPCNCASTFANNCGEWVIQLPSPLAEGPQVISAVQQESECSLFEPAFSSFTVSLAP